MLLSKRDLDEPVFKQYLENYDRIAAQDLNHSIQDTKYLTAQALKIPGYIRNDVFGAEVCEVGVGQGFLLRTLASMKPARIVGLDISLPYLKPLSREGFEVYLCNAENLPFKDAFQVLIATDILEHVLNVGDFLVSANRALVMNGKLVVRVPLEEDLVSYAQQMDCPFRFVHLRTFSRRGLIVMLEQAGFQVEAVHFDGFQRAYPQEYLPERVAKRMVEFIEGRSRWVHGVPSIGGWWGRFFFRPFEIAAVCVKVRPLKP
ncbi:MAG: methyltransferase domain-containing protein [Nitrospira sp.]|jgi:ubiquinone/menaquinone biosynthesis C-methylase UbiE|nr:class I SAM-dependent methyltransferase [Nitrospira sp. BO4]